MDKVIENFYVEDDILKAQTEFRKLMASVIFFAVDY